MADQAVSATSTSNDESRFTFYLQRRRVELITVKKLSSSILLVRLHLNRHPHEKVQERVIVTSSISEPLTESMTRQYNAV